MPTPRALLTRASGASTGSYEGGLDEIVESKGEFDKNVGMARWTNARTTAVHGRRLLSAEQDQPHGIEHDAQVFQLGNQGKAALFQGLVHGRIPGCAGQEHHSISKMG